MERADLLCVGSKEAVKKSISRPTTKLTNMSQVDWVELNALLLKLACRGDTQEINGSGQE